MSEETTKGQQDSSTKVQQELSTQTSVIDDEKLAKLTEVELREYVKTTLHAKRSANEEASKANDELKKYKEAEQKAKESQMKEAELLIIRTKELEDANKKYVDLQLSISREKLVSKASSILASEGYPQKLIDKGLPNDLSDGNFDEYLKSFRKDYAEFKKDVKGNTNPFIVTQSSVKNPEKKQDSPIDRAVKSVLKQGK